jgi:hypothetical protein
MLRMVYASNWPDEKTKMLSQVTGFLIGIKGYVRTSFKSLGAKSNELFIRCPVCNATDGGKARCRQRYRVHGSYERDSNQGSPPAKDDNCAHAGERNP